MKDEITQDEERESGETKQRAAVRNIRPLMGTYVRAVGPGDLATALADLLADLRHWAAHAGLDFDAALKAADDNYQAESDD